jgi:hypothetical protein
VTHSIATKRVPKVSVVEDKPAVGSGEARRAKSCLRVLAPIRLLGKARGKGTFEKLGAVLSKYGVEGRGRRVGTCRKPLKKVNLVQTMIKLVALLHAGERLRACRCWGRPPASRSIAVSTLLAGVMGTGFSRTVINAVRQSNGSRLREGSCKNATDSV